MIYFSKENELKNDASFVVTHFLRNLLQLFNLTISILAINTTVKQQQQ